MFPLLLLYYTVSSAASAFYCLESWEVIYKSSFNPLDLHPKPVVGTEVQSEWSEPAWFRFMFLQLM